MIQLLNGRILKDNNYTHISCFVILNGEETPVYSYDKVNEIGLKKQLNIPAIAGVSFSDGGAWTYYTLDDYPEDIVFKFHIKFFNGKTDVATQMYFCPSVNVNSYTTKTINAGDDSALEVKALINGGVKYMGEALLLERGIEINKNYFDKKIHGRLVKKKEIENNA